MTIISIILVFGALIFFHELGHLLLAKRAGILCREFAIGFGPKLFAFKKGETLYTIRLLPLGGYVRMAGEDPELIEIKTGHDVGVVIGSSGKVEKLILNNKQEYPEATVINVRKVDIVHDLVIEGYNVDDELVSYEIHPQAMLVHNRQETQIAPWDRQFGGKTLGQRAAALFAGPAANFLLAFFLLVGYALYEGFPVPIIDEVMPDSPAQEAGLQKGDLIVSINDQPITYWRDLHAVIGKKKGKEVIIEIERNGKIIEVPITPIVHEVEESRAQPRGVIGVTAMNEKDVIGSVKYGFQTSVNYAKLIFTGLGMLITGGFNIDDLAGPVGIMDITGQAAKQGLFPLVHWTAILSVNLAIMNLLPIPALDGGRLLFLAVEGVRGRPMDPNKEGFVNLVGFAFLMLLILVVTWNDIQRLISN